jgi:hypothetical protein
MRLVRVASGSASPKVIITVGPVCEGTPRALTQEAAVCSATESLGSPVPRGPGRRHVRVATYDGHALDWEASGDD